MVLLIIYCGKVHPHEGVYGNHSRLAACNHEMGTSAPAVACSISCGKGCWEFRVHQAGLWLCSCMCLLTNRLDLSVRVYCVAINEQRSTFVSVVHHYSGAVLGNPVLNAKIITAVTGFCRKSPVICWQLKFSEEDIQPSLPYDIWFTDSLSKSAKYVSMPYHTDILGKKKGDSNSISTPN